MLMTTGPSRSAKVQGQINSPAMRGAHRDYTKKLQTRYNKGVQANCESRREKIWHKRHIVYHTQSGCVSITLCSPLSIDEK